MEALWGSSSYWLTRLCFQRALGIIYLVAFLIALNQARPLIGEHGLLPTPLFLKRISFWDSPSLFWFHYSDRFLMIVAWTGVVLSVMAITGFSDALGLVFSIVVWGLLWLLYLSIVNIGQTFYSFGWEILLLETGFLAIFLGSSDTRPPTVVIWLLRWLLFRMMFGAGLIKLRGDPCWKDLTCLTYHYETQPLPNPVSWYLHHMPVWFHKLGVLVNHFVELVVPWGFFLGRFVCAIAGGLTFLFQVVLITSGNLSWLNYITLVLCIPCFDDELLSKFIPISPHGTSPMGLVRQTILGGLTAFILFLSIRPIQNMISSRQIMNTSFNSLHLVNTYGAFGSVTRERMEIVIEGTTDPLPTSSTPWQEYEFKGKPGNLRRAPCVISPYHWKLDWQMWFAAMSEYWYHPWFVHLMAKLLQNDNDVLGLLAHNPFQGNAPAFVRARLYEYHFTKPSDKSPAWWKRTFVREYLPPLSLRDPQFREILRHQGWLAQKTD